MDDSVHTRHSTPSTDAAPVRIKGFDDIPPLETKIFVFQRAGRRYEIAYTPLTYADVEEIRASRLPPKPPMRKIAGLENLKGKELAQRLMAGLPTYEPDTDDPAYQAAVVRYNNDVRLEQVRRALGWDVPSDTFLAEIRRRLNPGELQALMDEVDSTAWNVDSSLVDRLLRNFSSPSTDTDAASPTSEIS